MNHLKQRDSLLRRLRPPSRLSERLANRNLPRGIDPELARQARAMRKQGRNKRRERLQGQAGQDG